MSYLLDTNVISEIAKSTPHPVVAAWYARSNENDLYLSVVTLGEIRKGVELKRRSDRNRAAALDRMLTRLQTEYASRLLPVDRVVAEEWGRLAVLNAHHPIDRLLAATAKVHGMTLVTRNVRHVATFPLSVMNPFEPR